LPPRFIQANTITFRAPLSRLLEVTVVCLWFSQQPDASQIARLGGCKPETAVRVFELFDLCRGGGKTFPGSTMPHQVEKPLGDIP